MANPKKRVPENVPGDFFVDSTCIDCDACRQIAPSVFGEAAETSYVKSQPITSADRRQALQALLACPTGSIGCLGDDNVKAVMKDFPLVIEEPVFYCGYNSPKSYGGNSYFVRHPAGNWLIDSPKFVTPLVKQLEALGGVANIFLTHRDDVADAERFARHFKSRRIIHRDELSSQPGAEVVLDGKGPWELAPGFLAIPTSGHTKGHCVLLFQDRFLFTGDHSGLESRRAAPFGLRGLLLVFVAGAGRVDKAVGGLSLRMGVARPRPEGTFAGSRDESANPALGRDDDGKEQAVIHLPPPPVSRLVGFVMKSVEPGRAVFEMETDERHHNPMGTVHGGIYCDLADAAMGFAYAATLGEGETFTTIELKINFLRAVRKATLTAEARVVKAGSTVGYVECEVKDHTGKLVAKAASTCMKLRQDRSGAQEERF